MTGTECVVLFFKSRIDPYVRGGRLVRGYTNSRPVHIEKDKGTRQLAFVFPGHGVIQKLRTPANAEVKPSEVKKFYATVIREPGTAAQKVGYLAGPFDTHPEAEAHVERARAAARELDPFTEFDSFGTAGLTLAPGKHPPGKLNARLGLS